MHGNARSRPTANIAPRTFGVAADPGRLGTGPATRPDRAAPSEAVMVSDLQTSGRSICTALGFPWAGRFASVAVVRWAPRVVQDSRKLLLIESSNGLNR